MATGNTLLNDEPSIDLDANSERWQILRRLALDLAGCEPPCVFGLHGDWGAGKTSFLGRLYLELNPNEVCPPCRDVAAYIKESKWKRDAEIEKVHLRVLPIWFEAWRYQNEPVPIVALLHELRRQILANDGPFEKVRGKTKQLAWLGRHAAGQMIESVTAKIGWESPKVCGASLGGPKVEASVKLPSIPAARLAYDEEHFSGALSTDKLREQLETAIELLMPNDRTEGRRLERVMNFLGGKVCTL